MCEDDGDGNENENGKGKNSPHEWTNTSRIEQEQGKEGRKENKREEETRKWYHDTMLGSSNQDQGEGGFKEGIGKGIIQSRADVW